MRKSDSDKDNVSHFRTTDRVMRMNDQWWFATREGDMGPFATREEAEMAIKTFIASQQFVEGRDAPPEPVRKSAFKGDTTIWDRQIDSI